MKRIIWTAVFCFALSTATIADEDHPATCFGLIGVMDAAAATNDPTGPQAYINLADSIYERLNQEMLIRKMVPLPLPADPDSEALRLMEVVSQCRRQMSIKFSDAVAYSWIKMRADAGLQITLPP